MKFALAQLKKLNMPYHYSEELDLNPDLVGVEDILQVKETKVEGIINEIDKELYEINFQVSCNLILECAISLKEVPYTLNINFSEKFSTNPDYEDSFLIDKQTLDTKEAIITNILIAKPSKVYAPGVEFISDEEEIKEENVNEAFKSLKDLL